MVDLVYPFRRRRKKLIIIKETFSKKWAVPGLFLFIFAFFKQKLQSLQQINVKRAHTVYSAEIRTHDPRNMSLLP